MAKAGRQKLKRSDFQDLARARITEAEHLLNMKSFAGAYYLTGIAVECALKACIAKGTEEFEFPDLDRAKEGWNHDLTKLLSASGLLAEHAKMSSADADFNANWLIVKDWDISSRYEKSSQGDAQALFDAVLNPKHGMFQWIERHW